MSSNWHYGLSPDYQDAAFSPMYAGFQRFLMHGSTRVVLMDFTSYFDCAYKDGKSEGFPVTAQDVEHEFRDMT